MLAHPNLFTCRKSRQGSVNCQLGQGVQRPCSNRISQIENRQSSPIRNPYSAIRNPALVLLLIAALASSAPAAADQVLTTRVGEVDVALFVPGNVPVLRGLYVHAANYKLKADDRWAESGRSIGFGHIALNLPNIQKATNRPVKLRKALDESLQEFAAKANRPELLHVPFAGVGHSAGGLVAPTLLKTPQRVVALCVDCGWVSDPRKLQPSDKSVPFLFTLGAVPDAFKMLPTIDQNFLPARAEGWPWGLGVQWGCAHDFANSAALMTAWVEAAVAARLPADWAPRRGPPALRDIRLEDGWLGDRSTIEGTWATVASWKDYRGDRDKATWLVDRSVAFVWRAWQTKDSPVHLHVACPHEGKQLPPWNPKAERGLTIGQGSAIELSVVVSGQLALKRVEYYSRDRLLGASDSAPWRLEVKDLPAGAHPISVIWHTTDGKCGAANPALITVRLKPAEKTP